VTKEVWMKIGARKSRFGSKWEISTVATFVKSKPNCKANEIALKMTLDVPDEIFEEPVYNLKIALPKPPAKHVEPADLAKEMTKAMSDRMGMKVRVTMDTNEKPFTESLKNL